MLQSILLKIKVFILAIMLFCLGCTSPKTLIKTPQIAPITLAPLPLPPVMEYPLEELDVGELMEIGSIQWDKELWSKAANTFRLAIKTGRLNDMGLAVAWWYIGLGKQFDKHDDEAAEAFFFFTVTASDVLNPTDWEHNPIPKDEKFIEGFELLYKLDYASKYINMLWKHRTQPL